MVCPLGSSLIGNEFIHQSCGEAKGEGGGDIFSLCGRRPMGYVQEVTILNTGQPKWEISWGYY